MLLYVALCYGRRIVDGTVELANELKLLVNTINQLVEIQILVEKRVFYFFGRGTTCASLGTRQENYGNVWMCVKTMWEKKINTVLHTLSKGSSISVNG